MILHCNNCGTEISPYTNFCPFCGLEAPRRTIPGGVGREEITEGICCAHCAEKNIKEAIYCSACGKSVYRRPAGKVLCCPHCGQKNSVNARHCCDCGLLLDDWFAMRGETAERLGHSGNLTLQETMSNTTYRFFTQNLVSIGRTPENDIVIPSQLVSSKHCVFNLNEMKLLDRQSLNGTYINRSSARITSVPLSRIDELNIAGSFTFSVMRSEKLFALQLTAILEDGDSESPVGNEACQALRLYYFVLVLGGGKLTIRKMDGKIVTEMEPAHRHCSISMLNGRYYFTDLDSDIDEQLILKKHNRLPVNWRVLY